jgi:hypothetical protein
MKWNSISHMRHGLRAKYVAVIVQGLNNLSPSEFTVPSHRKYPDTVLFP